MTHVFGVIGNPISHSLSPLMHEAAYKKLELDARYVPFQVEEKNLETAVKGMKGLGIKGLNVTIPHKEAVIEFLDELDPSAAALGAVNTIFYDEKQNKLIGYNTDGEGFYRSLRPELRKPLEDSLILMIGAGGAARGVAITLAGKGAKQLTIANRTKSKAEELAADCGASARAMTLNEAQAKLTEFDIIINSTSIGMTPNIGQMPMSLETLSRDTLVCDLIYSPMKTRFLAEAEKKHVRTLNGMGMFVQQGAIAFEHWTGLDAPVEIMEEAILSRLKEV
ncbi:shikimate dehydrogenase [Alkalicoccus daliensis]|uniref:Shikimate dehydrogenase (NADP(+)) n=1 Tax=Alkalicoccus daliensis TaxID=745820 RepID=A0A1H0BFL4_9BACI|nr:shikimate dehydrogenase [Alkalicoccus daliensis]SDN44469.1 shikimate dehydrogenase [Alkalicoccus daliensis]